MRNRNLVIIFVRNPVLGKVKTRLSKSVGDLAALKIYQLLLEKTKKATQVLSCDKVVFYSKEIIHNDLWDTPAYQKELQIGDDLGSRMEHAFQINFEKNYKKIVLIGSDLYDLNPSLINEAFKKLIQNEVVIGPSKDGGYYLLGLKKGYPKIFRNKKWGTSSVREDTLKDLENINVHSLALMNDIDVVEDLREYPRLCEFMSG